MTGKSLWFLIAVATAHLPFLHSTAGENLQLEHEMVWHMWGGRGMGGGVRQAGGELRTPHRSGKITSVVDHALNDSQAVQNFLRDEPGEGVVEDQHVGPGVLHHQMTTDRLLV